MYDVNKASMSMISVDMQVYSASTEGLNKPMGLIAVLPERDREQFSASCASPWVK